MRRSRDLPRVAVLLSTYNGEAFLAAQLQSLRDQEGVEVRLHARDDGSSDGTLKILREHTKVCPELAHVESGRNLGPAASFLDLLCTAPGDADYYAFCDQDDVWLPGKLARAVAALAAETGPALYCSNVTCVAEDLSVLGMPRENGDARLQHLLFENIAYGCTTVMNRAARDLIAARPPEQGMIMHDWWCALVVAAFGRVVFDPEAQVLYRQHGGNSIGAETNRLIQILSKAHGFIRAPQSFYRVQRQAAEFDRLFGPRLSDVDRRSVQRLARSRRSFHERVALALSGEVIRSRPLDALIARGLILAGWY